MSLRRPLVLLCLALASLAAAPAGAAGAEREPYVVVLSEGVQGVDGAIDRRERRDGFAARLRYRSALKGFSARLDARQAAALRLDPTVSAVVRDRPVHASAAVPLAAGEPVPPPGIRRLGAATRTTVSGAADGAVAVVDSGVDLSHPDLLVSSGTNCLTPDAPATDDNGHGTHVAGTIAARNNGSGVVGVAPGTRIYAVKVLDAAGEGSWSSVICGIDWVTANAATLGIRVANLSLGGPGADDGRCGRANGDVLHRAICRAATAGVLGVVAAGNDSADAGAEVPAAYREVLTVTAMADTDGRPGAIGPRPSCSSADADDARASFSNFFAGDAMAAHTVAAPGVCIRSTLPGGGWGLMSGTSMAAPHVAGVAAACMGEAGVPGPCAGLTPAETITRTVRASVDQGPASGFLGDPWQVLPTTYGALVAPAATAAEPAPTATPTALPTATPTAAPTASPTAAPTAVPTTAPTASPTAAPTAVPTTAPTAAPTATPTAPPATPAPEAPTGAPASSPAISPPEATAPATPPATATPTAPPATPAPEAPAPTPPTAAPTATSPPSPPEAPAATPATGPASAPPAELPLPTETGAAIFALGLPEPPFAPLAAATPSVSLSVAPRTRRAALRSGLRLAVRCVPVCVTGARVEIRSGRRVLQRSTVATGRAVTVRPNRILRAFTAHRSTVRLTVMAVTDAGRREARLTLR
jgi:subtilisin family serine protease